MGIQTDILRTIIQCDGAETTARKFGALGNAASETEKKLQAMADKAGAISLVAGGIGTGMLAAAGGLIKVAGAAEQAQIAFTTLLKSPQEAKKHLAELASFAANTPFEFTGLRTLSTQLLAYGFNVRSVIPMLRSLGDAGSALGQGPEGLSRMIRAMGQIQAKGRVMMQELNQLAEAGVPVYQILQQELGLTAAQVGEIGRTGVSAKDGIAALLRGMDKLYGGGMAAQSKTLFGVMSNLKDQFALLGMELGGTLIPSATDGANALRELTERLRSMSPWARRAVAAFLLFGGVGMIMVSIGARVAQLTILWQLAAAQKRRAAIEMIAGETQYQAALQRTMAAETRLQATRARSSMVARGPLSGRFGQAQTAIGMTMAGVRGYEAFDPELDAGEKMGKVAAAAGYLAGAFNPLILATTALGEVIGAVVEGYYTRKAAQTAARTGNAPGIIGGEVVRDPKRLAAQMMEPEYAMMSAGQFLRAAQKNWANAARNAAVHGGALAAQGSVDTSKADLAAAGAATARAKAVLGYQEASGQSHGVAQVQTALMAESAAHRKIAESLKVQAMFAADAAERKALYTKASEHETTALEKLTEARKTGNDQVERERRAAEKAVKENDERVKKAIDEKRKAVEAYTKAIDAQTDALNRTLSTGSAYAEYLDTIGATAQADAYRRGELSRQAATNAQFAFATGDALSGWRAATEAERLARAGTDAKGGLGFSTGGARTGALTGAVPGYMAAAAGRSSANIHLRQSIVVRDEAGTTRARIRREDRQREYQAR